MPHLYRNLFALMILGFMPGLMAQGLLVTPQRVVFEGRSKSQVITLFNKGNKQTTYRMSFIQKRMTEEGELIDMVAEDGNFADGMIRFSPRSVILGPKQSQKVRLLLRKPAGLAMGEYRSHLMFLAIPSEDAGLQIDSLNRKDNGVGIQLTPVFGVSIPVIVRQGTLDLDVNIARLNLSEGAAGAPYLLMDFQRQGGKSVYGHVSTHFIPVPGAEPTRVGFVRGMAIYTGINRRSLSLPLKPPKDVSLASGRLLVTYRDEDDQILAQKELVLP